MTFNSLRPRLHTGIFSLKRSSIHSQSPHPHQQQFIPGDGIDTQIFGAYVAYFFPEEVDWRPAVNVADGREGFLLKAHVPLDPEHIEILKSQTKQLREGKQQIYDARCFEKLHSDWAQQGYQLVPQPEERHQGQMQHQNVRQPVQRVQQPQIQAQQRVAAQQPRPDLEHARISDFGSLPVLPSAPEPRIPIPFVDVPPTYDEVMGARSSIRTQVESSIRRLAVTNTRPRPASCPDLTVISPTGGYYPDGYDDAGPSEIHRQEPPRRPFMDGPPALPEFVISPTDDADHHPPGLPFSPYHPLRQVRSVGGFGNAGSWAS